MQYMIKNVLKKKNNKDEEEKSRCTYEFLGSLFYQYITDNTYSALVNNYAFNIQYTAYWNTEAQLMLIRQAEQ